ncbi:RHS repeat-associated core domain-containing protein [Gynuella sunshinyii]|nr:RHS repeat-associated core domain-containing protein [Gynuella sunshinyii]
MPPDPADVAPSLSNTEYTSMADATKFLYSGDSPIQTGVTDGTIEEKRVAVIRGQVFSRENEPLSGVTISIKDHGEYGQTLSRADGRFDLAINGGRAVFVNYQKEGYLTVQRQVDTPWRDYVMADDVVMLALDAKVTAIDLENSSSVQVAQGSEQTDTSGSRQATVLFPTGTSATMILANGSTQTLNSLHVRATEYTVGENGPKAMPGKLPISSGYTYAVELSVDEAIQAGATHVTFNQPLPVYVDNFLEFPTGEVVPAGWYDQNKMAWVPSNNGRVIEILNITDDGLAELDVAGTGEVAESDLLAIMNITEAERKYLGEYYAVGKTLWRVPVQHFTPWDFNWPYGLPEGATTPPVIEDQPILDSEDCDTCEGSIVEAQTQSLAEEIPVAGTPYSLYYNSNRTSGYSGSRTVTVPLARDSVPSPLKYVEVSIDIAGKTVTQKFDQVSPNDTFTYTWDGLDAYRRSAYSSRASISVNYTYDPVYYPADPAGFMAANQPDIQDPEWLQQFAPDWLASFAQIGDKTRVIGLSRSEIVTTTRWHQPLTIHQTQIQMGLWDFNIHHHYDPIHFTLYKGNGEQRQAKGVDKVIKLIAGALNRTEGYNGDEQPATQAMLDNILGIAIGEDGSIFIADSDNNRIRKVTPDGVIHTIAGTGEKGYSGDGGSASEATFSWITDVTIDHNGNIFVAEGGNDVIRKISQDGIITTVAGTGEPRSNDYKNARNGVSALEISIKPDALVVAADGTLYFGDYYTNGIYKVTPDDKATLLIGRPDRDYTEGGGPLIKQFIGTPHSMALAADNTLYIAASDGVFQFSPTGELSQIFDHNSEAITVDDDGNIYFGSDTRLSSGVEHLLYKRNANGEITVVAGGGNVVESDTSTAQRLLFTVTGLAIGPDGAIYLSESKFVSQISPAFGMIAADDEIAIPDNSGQEVYIFSDTGRHLRTLDTVTGKARYTFGYDDNGMLVSIMDLDGNTTTIERLSDGTAAAIVSPDGQYTTLTMENNGYLADISNPNAESYHMSYSDDGLLTQFTYPSGASSQMTYDNLGYLLTDTNAAGGGWQLARENGATGYTTTMTSAEGRVRHFSVTQQDRSVLKTNTAPDSRVTKTILADGSQTVTSADGMTVHTQQGPDARFSMIAPIDSVTQITTPSGLVKTIQQKSQATLSDQHNPFSHTKLINELIVNGDKYSWNPSYTRVYDTEARTWTHTTPESYTMTELLDEKGHLSKKTISGLDSFNYHYDERGRLIQIDRGDSAVRKVSFGYDLNGYLSSITNARNQTVSYSNDAVGRVLSQTNPNGNTLKYAYDANGNLTRLTLANGEVHQFSYTTVDQQDQYTPPDADSSANEGSTGSDYPGTKYIYNLDQQLTQVTRPDGDIIEYHYDQTSGQLISVGIPQGDYVYGYYGDTSTSEINSGQLKTLTSPQGEQLRYQYDGSLLTDIHWTGDTSGTLSYTYNNNFEPITQSLNGDPVELSYNHDGQLTGIGILSIYHRRYNGLLSGTRLGNITSSQGYNSLGELDSYSTEDGSNTLYSYTLERDSTGKIIGKTETLSGVTSKYEYQYDSLDQLTKVVKDGVLSELYTYDNNGNRLSDLNNNAGRYDAQDRLLSYGDIHYTYSANGELKSKTENGKTDTYHYDAFSNLLSVTQNDGTRIEYVIDGQNRRVGKKVDGELVQGFLYQGQLNPVAELDGKSNVVSRFIYGEKLNVPSYMIKGGATYRIISDHLGSVRLVINADTGETVQQINYDSFGNIEADSNPGFQPFGFAGGLYDQHTKLTRFGARDYDAGIGRWTSKDLIRFGGGQFNIYTYAANNPVNMIDPNGQFIWVAAGALVGGITNLAVTYIANGGDISLKQGIGAFASGAISGAVGALAGPLGGTLAKSLTGSASMAAGTMSRMVSGLSQLAMNAFGGALGQEAANIIDPCHASGVANAAVFGYLGSVGGLMPSRGLSTLAQAKYFGPSFRSLMATPNGRRIAMAMGVSGMIGAGASFGGPF